MVVMIEIILPIALFGLVSAATPGPNTIMLTASGSAFGFQRTLPHILGITLGFPLMVFAIGLGVGEIFTRYPQVHLVLKYVGAAYLLYLAWRIAQSGRPNAGEAKARPLNFLEAAGFQWVNPKAWMIAVSAIPAFTTIGGHYYAELRRVVPLRRRHPHAHSHGGNGKTGQSCPGRRTGRVRRPAVPLD